jgi:diguanylate cyclase (GGDEF)-like protein
MLEGFDPDWVPLGEKRSVTYTNLDAGSYVFRLRAANSDGVWNEEGLAVGVDMQAAPWRTPWAYALYVALLAAAGYAVASHQRRKLEREAEYARILEARVEERTRELSERQEELEKANYDLAQASITDALTGLANRRFLQEYLESFLQEYLEREVPLLHRRYAKLETGTLDADSIDMAFLMVDLDRFKDVNDTEGHAAGDELLKQIKILLTSVSRSSDIIVRWGGDEFLVVARDQTGDGLIEFAERIRKTIEEHEFDIGDERTAHTTCSIGFARYPFVRHSIDALSWEQVMSIADKAMYLAKASGRNAWVGLHPGVAPLPTEGLYDAIREDTQRLVQDGGLRVSSSLTGIRKLSWEEPAEDERRAAAGGETGGARVLPMPSDRRGPSSRED